jgi:hypothetical protein
MPDRNNDYINNFNSNDNVGDFGLDARNPSAGSESASAANDTDHSGGVMAEAIDFIPVKLDLFRLWSSDRKRNLALKLASRGQAIAVPVLTWGQSVQELRNRLITATSNTLEELSDILGISRERVRQLEVTALEKMRNWISEHDLVLPNL